jgi:hypothetical protein
MVTLVVMDAAAEASKPVATRDSKKKKRPESLLIASSVSFMSGMLQRLEKFPGYVKREMRMQGRDFCGCSAATQTEVFG